MLFMTPHKVRLLESWPHLSDQHSSTTAVAVIISRCSNPSFLRCEYSGQVPRTGVWDRMGKICSLWLLYDSVWLHMSKTLLLRPKLDLLYSQDQWHWQMGKSNLSSKSNRHGFFILTSNFAIFPDVSMSTLRDTMIIVKKKKKTLQKYTCILMSLYYPENALG